MNAQFDSLPLKKSLLENLEQLEFHSMTPIQAKSLPLALAGSDLIAQAKTGSGKTAAFALSILNSLDVSNLQTQALILCPTRELAEQVAQETRMLARMMSNVKVLTICGGASEYLQEKSLSHGAHIVVGTPGRIGRLLKKNTINLSNIKTFVLDEADRMLDMGFSDQIMQVVSYLPSTKQTLLFSATYPEEILQLSDNVQNSAVEVKVDVEHQPNSIEQYFYLVGGHQEKNQALLTILGNFKPDRLIVFCKTKQITDDVADFLIHKGISAAAIHGDLMQNQRTAVLTKFSNRSLSILVATDVAARGLDIKDLAAVINYDLPLDPEVYIHRIGRTGRAGSVGMAFSLFVDQERYKLDAIAEQYREKFKLDKISSLSATARYELLPPMTSMFIGGGKKDKLRPGDILGALVGEANLEANDVGEITIFNTMSFVALKNEVIDHAIKKLRSGKIKNSRFKIGYA